MRFVKKIRKGGTGISLEITVPVDVVEAMELRDGDLVEIELKKVEK